MDREGSPSASPPQPREDLEASIERQRESGSLAKRMAHLSALLAKDSSELVIRKKNRSLRQQKCRDSAAKIWADAASKEVFPFFALPTELRLAVYFELLVTDNRLVVKWQGPRKKEVQQKPIYTSILRASKQCRDEGLTVLYGENIFDMEEICAKPVKIAKPFLSCIGNHNASLIRIVIAEYSAAAEEIYQLGPAGSFQLTPELHMSGTNAFINNTKLPYPYLSVGNLTTFLSTFGIDIDQLRLMAISIVPYGLEPAYRILMRKQAPLVVNNIKERVLWLEVKNEPERMRKLVDGICEREHYLTTAEYWGDIDAKIGFDWYNPNGTLRPWVVVRSSKSDEDGSGKRKTSGKGTDAGQKRLKA